MSIIGQCTMLMYGGIDVSPYKLHNILRWLRKTKCLDVKRLRKEFNLTRDQAERIMGKRKAEIELVEEYEDLKRRKMGAFYK